MQETFLELCLQGKAIPEDWESYVNKNVSQETKPHELLGIGESDFAKLMQKQHTFEFFVMRRKIGCKLKRVWPGTYVSFIVEHDNKPHIEFGWVDVIDVAGRLCKVQCDDSFHGMRAFVITIDDIVAILPFKERPLVFYKTVLCEDCNRCDRSANEAVPSNCPHERFFNAILDKQVADAQFLVIYTKDNLANQDNTQDGHKGQ